MSFILLRVETYDLDKTASRYSEVETADFNPLIWNTKNSAGWGDSPIEKADEKHKRDLFRDGSV
jgi:hypothetical protein